LQQLVAPQSTAVPCLGTLSSAVSTLLTEHPLDGEGSGWRWLAASPEGHSGRLLLCALLRALGVLQHDPTQHPKP
jgi:hypothetical protein